MSFYDELTKRGLNQMIYGTTFKTVVPMGGRKFAEAIKDIVTNNRSVYLDEDCDIDGYLSVLSLKTMFDVLGFKNYHIPVHVYKRHGVTVDLIKPMLDESKFDYYIITDSSTNNEDVFELFMQYNNANCIVIDHHKTCVDRHKYNNSNVLLINPKLDTAEKGVESLANEMSACCVISLLIEYVMKTCFKERYDDLKGAHFVYGYISLYSDCCKFNLYNVAYARKVIESHYPYPKLVELFMDKWSTLNRTFVSWRLNPRLNALFRDEFFSLAYKLFYEPQKAIDEGILEQIETIYANSKKTVAYLSSSTKVLDKENYIVGILPDIPRARNYTGLVASDLSGKYNKPAMILLKVNKDTYEGSVRDLYSRNLLEIFQTVMYAEGHGPAFGVQLKKDNLEDVIYVLDDLLDNVSTTDSGIILVDWSFYTSKDKDLLDDIQLMSEYNEFSGQGDLPVAYAKLPIKANMSIVDTKKSTRIHWGKIEMILFNKYISKGDTAIVQPSHPGKLIIKNVTYHV